MKNFYLRFISGVSLFALPFVVNAQTQQGSSGCATEITSIGVLFDMVTCILRRSVFPMLIAISVIVFIVGVIRYISNAEDSSKREEGRNFMIYGIVGLFVMVSVWALVGVIQGTFGFSQGVQFIPQLQE